MSRRRPARRSRAGRRLLALVVTLVVLACLALAADALARGYVQNRVAGQIQRDGFPRRPDVSIEGFPFLTQLAARDFPRVRISAGDVTERRVTFKTIRATLNGVRLNSAYDGGTVGRLTGRALVTFPALARALGSAVSAGGPVGLAGPMARALTLSAAGRREVRAQVDLVLTGSATWRLSVAGHRRLLARLTSSRGLPAALAGAVATIVLPLPALPLGLTISGVRVTPHGLVCRIGGTHLHFGGSG